MSGYCLRGIPLFSILNTGNLQGGRSMGSLDGRVAVVTGAGRGLGAAHAKLLAREGARVVVNDLQRRSEHPAADVVEEIRAAGGEAVASGHDITEWDSGRAL